MMFLMEEGGVPRRNADDEDVMDGDIEAILLGVVALEMASMMGLGVV